MKSFKRGSYPVVLAVILMTCMTFLGGCGGDERVLDPQPGDSFEATLSVASGDESTLLQTVTYRAYNLEITSDDEEPVVIILADSATERNKATGRMETVKAGSGGAETLANIQDWLADHWDAYVGTLGDEGIDAAEFMAYLEERNISGQTFMTLFDESGMVSMEEFVAFADALAEALSWGDDSLNDLEWFLDRLPDLSSQDVSMDLGVFLGELEVAFPQDGYQAFFDWMRDGELDFNGLFNLYGNYIEAMTEEPEKQDFAAFLAFLCAPDEGMVPGSRMADLKDVNEALEALNNMVKNGLEVTKFAWDVIKDGKPQVAVDGAFTSVLSGKDKDPLSYYAARESQSPIYRFEIHDSLFTSWVLMKVRFQGECSYDARHLSLGGRYLPNIHFEVLDSYVFWGLHLNVSTQASKPVNISTDPNNPNPQMDLVVNVDTGWFFENITRSIKYRATGTGGIWMR